MELKELVQLLKTHSSVVIGFGLAVGLLAGLAVRSYSPHFVASFNLHVSKSPEVSVDNYNYDGFYAQQVAEGYIDTVVGLLESRELLVQALAQTGLDPASAGRYRQSITVQKVAPQLIRLEVSRRGQDEAARLTQALAQAAQEKVHQLNRERNQEFVLELIEDSPLVEYAEFSPWIAALAGAVGGLLLAAGTLVLKVYLKKT